MGNFDLQLLIKILLIEKSKKNCSTYYREYYLKTKTKSSKINGNILSSNSRNNLIKN